MITPFFYYTSCQTFINNVVAKLSLLLLLLYKISSEDIFQKVTCVAFIIHSFSKFNCRRTQKKNNNCPCQNCWSVKKLMLLVSVLSWGYFLSVLLFKVRWDEHWNPKSKLNRQRAGGRGEVFSKLVWFWKGHVKLETHFSKESFGY